jgi:hypothetical protein
LEKDSSTRDFERRIKGALGMEHFCLKKISAEGSFTGDRGRYLIKERYITVKNNNIHMMCVITIGGDMFRL